VKKVIGGEILTKIFLHLKVNSTKGYAENDVDGKKILVVFSPDLVEKIMIKKQKYFSRGITILKIKNFFGEGLLTSDEPLHIKNRRIVQKSFHKDYYDSFLFSSFNIMNELINENKSKVEIIRLTDRFAFDSLSECFLQTKFPERYISVFHDLSEKSANVPGIKFDKEIMSDFLEMKKEIAEFITKNKNVGFIQNMQDNGMDDNQILDEVLTVLGAGFETTAALCSWILLHLDQDRDILSQLLENIPEWAKQNRAPLHEELFDSELMNGIIKETLRIHPTVYLTTRMAAQDINIDDIEMKQGENVFLSQYVTHRDEKYYDNPNEWNPYRWTPEFEKALPKGAYFPFGLGSRKCIGEHFSKTMAYMFIFNFIYNYNFTLEGNFPNEKYLFSLLPDGNIVFEISKRK
jgi:cytochrome P450